MNNFICPLTGEKDELEIIEEIDSHELISLYKRVRGIDISEEIQTEKLIFIKNRKINFYFFYPFVSGSSKFYEELTSKPQYVAEKDEYLFASKYIKNTDKVLDVGCGWGWFKNYIPDSDYMGIEFSEKSIQKCKEKNINVTSVLIQDFAKKDEKFDVVVSFQVLEHIENPLFFVKSMAESATEKGLIILSVPNLDSFMSIRENNYLNLPPHHISWWSKDSLKYIADALNLEVLDYEVERLKDFNTIMDTYLKNLLNTLFKRKKKLIRNHWFDLFVIKLLNRMGRLFPKPQPQIMPNGHSITIVFRKK